MAKLMATGQVAAGGIVFNQLTTGYSSINKIAFLVNRIEYFFPPSWLATIVTAGGFIRMALSAVNSLTIAQFTEASSSLYDLAEIDCSATPAALGGPFHRDSPLIHEFAPGNELLVLPQNLFMGLGWATTANISALNANIRMWYKELELGPQDWFDLLQMRVPLGFGL
jgi:hypothetical protein